MSVSYFSGLQYESPLGSLFLVASETGLVSVTFDELHEFHISTHESAVLDQAKRELDEWFSGSRTSFSLPLAPKGTAFQQEVWEELLRIEFGHTTTYGQIARNLGKSGASRAVGSAIGKNPLLLLIPCHRVVGKKGPGGFSAGMHIKRALCSFEGIDLDSLF